MRPTPFPAPSATLQPRWATGVPLAFAFAFALGSLASLPFAILAENPSLAWSLLGAAGALAVWAAVTFVYARSRDRRLGIRIELRKQHWVQACAQGSVLLYWGYYWREVYHSAPLLLAQLLFAYSFDMLLTWSRRDTYVLGLGPFPVVFSINLFLWFRPDWFFLQFVMVALGFAAKALITWNKDGRRVHVFNPSSFPLAVFSFVLLATRTTSLTWGPQIATTLLRAPFIYPFLFAVGLVGQYFFGVTAMTMSAAVSMYAFGRIYEAATGAPYFRGEYIPVAVFLGMHLLFTDPATAPRTELGRILFGVAYTALIIGISALLSALGKPGFYDKLLPVPILNLTILAIDRVVRSGALARLDPGSIAPSLAPRRRNLVYMGIWALAFVAMTAAHAWRAAEGS